MDRDSPRSLPTQVRTLSFRELLLRGRFEEPSLRRPPPSLDPPPSASFSDLDEPFLETFLRDPAAELLVLVLGRGGCAVGSVLLLLLLLLLLPPPLVVVLLLLLMAASMSAAVAASEWDAVGRRLRELVRTDIGGGSSPGSKTGCSLNDG